MGEGRALSIGGMKPRYSLEMMPSRSMDLWPFKFFVNVRLRLIPDCCSQEAYQKLKVREAFYKNINLIDEFVQGNTAQSRQGLACQG